MATPDSRLVEGVRLFNRGEFFDAHEVVEDLWHETAGPERNLLKGFIQAAVACEHHRRGNARGRRSVGATAAAYLREYPARAHGLDVAGLVEGLDAFLARAERGEEGPYPSARLDGPAAAAGSADPPPEGEEERP
jgi:predicted metal-dependent hydrolase